MIRSFQWCLTIFLKPVRSTRAMSFWNASMIQRTIINWLDNCPEMRAQLFGEPNKD